MRVPHEYEPRFYQLPFLEEMDRGKKRACCVWHRKSGKTLTLLNFAIKKGFERVGTYYHAFPEYGQGRKVIWDGRENDGREFLSHVPMKLRRSTNKAEMKIELVNGSIWQVIGADNYDSLVGPNPVGIILDEWAVSDRYPRAWDYFRPILAQNGGWAVFVFTPRGRNHGWTLYQMALRNPEWFCQLLTVDHTGAVTSAAIDAERVAGMPEAMIQQEFYCSFMASVEDIVIPFDLIRGALDRDVQYGRSGRIAGLDVARFGNDRTALVVRQGGQIVHADTWQGVDLTMTAGKVVRAYRDMKLYDCIAVDVIGLGAGVYDMIHNAEVPCVAVNVGEGASDDSRFPRLRDQLWWKVREWFEEGACSISKGIPKAKRNELLADIQDIHYKYNLKQQIVIESKDDMKERLGFSPDLGDALCCTFAPAVEMKLPEGVRMPFGAVQGMNAMGVSYNPLIFGLGVN